MISVIIPSYRNPKCLDICIESALRGQNGDNDIICVLDGYAEESEGVIKKYENDINFLPLPENKGMQYALNMGVYNSKSEKILIVNDDNVFPINWDTILEDDYKENLILTPNQIEKSKSIFNFETEDFGTPETFDLENFFVEEPNFRKDELTNDGGIFPFMMSKKKYMMVGGFDTLYNSPFICDWDFFLKLEMMGMRFQRSHRLHFYHFGSKATKNRDTEKQDETMFRSGEAEAYQMFEYKWGFRPQNGINNSKKPTGRIRGIDYEKI